MWAIIYPGMLLSRINESAIRAKRKRKLKQENKKLTGKSYSVLFAVDRISLYRPQKSKSRWRACWVQKFVSASGRAPALDSPLLAAGCNRRHPFDCRFRPYSRSFYSCRGSPDSMAEGQGYRAARHWDLLHSRLRFLGEILQASHGSI